MGCANCTFRGITFADDNSVSSVSENDQKLRTSNWLNEYKQLKDERELIEVRFKNTRKEFFINKDNLLLKKGDLLAVESSNGHDIGTVSLLGKLAWLQIRKQEIPGGVDNLKKIFRKATASDLRNHRQAMELENPTMLRSRQIINELGLEMKLGDVEYQGDKSRAIFYYIADGRVDFRELIKLLAKEFRIRVEMKQIGARQEAGRIGGIGSCGRELCCSSWKTNFQSVSLNAAKVQDLPSNVQKLAGQCGKLKCCLTYELDSYLEAKEEIPKVLLELESTKGIAFHQKTDLLKRIMFYSYKEASMENAIAIPVERVKEIINLNKKGIKVDLLLEGITQELEEKTIEYGTELESINRFDKKKVDRGRRKKR